MLTTQNFHPILSKLSKATAQALHFGWLFTGGSTVFIILGKNVFKTATVRDEKFMWLFIDCIELY